MKRVLIIGAGNYQTPAVQRVRNLGYEAYCVDYKPGQPGFVYANGYRVIDVRIKNLVWFMHGNWVLTEY